MAIRKVLPNLPPAWTHRERFASSHLLNAREQMRQMKSFPNLSYETCYKTDPTKEERVVQRGSGSSRSTTVRKGYVQRGV